MYFNKKKRLDYYNLDKNKNILAPFTSKYSRLHTIEQLNAGKPQAAEAVICASEHLLLSLGPSGRTSSALLLHRQVCIFQT